MAYKTYIERRAQKTLHKLPWRDKERLIEAIDGLGQDPRPFGYGPVKTAPKGTYRIQVGNYRVVYFINDDEHQVIVTKVVKRDESTYRL